MVHGIQSINQRSFGRIPVTVVCVCCVPICAWLSASICDDWRSTVYYAVSHWSRRQSGIARCVAHFVIDCFVFGREGWDYNQAMHDCYCIKVMCDDIALWCVIPRNSKSLWRTKRGRLWAVVILMVRLYEVCTWFSQIDAMRPIVSLVVISWKEVVVMTQIIKYHMRSGSAWRSEFSQNDVAGQYLFNVCVFMPCVPQQAQADMFPNWLG